MRMRFGCTCACVVICVNPQDLYNSPHFLSGYSVITQQISLDALESA